jgi:uncharacterized membrane protein HdeD (DUF308 family)
MIEQHTADTSEPSFWIGFISGIGMIVAGVVTWLHPEWLIPVLGVIVIAEGLRLAWQGAFDRHGDGLDGLRIVIGLLAATCGVALVLAPDKSAPIVLYAASGLAIIFGLFLAILGIKDMNEVDGWWWEALIGVLLTCLGITVWINPQQGALTVAHIFSLLIVASGCMRILSAFQWRPGVRGKP